MGLVADIIGMVKTNTKLSCKDNIEKLKNYWPGDTYPVLNKKYMVPGNRPLISIGYKYNV